VFVLYVYAIRFSELNMKYDYDKCSIECYYFHFLRVTRKVATNLVLTTPYADFGSTFLYFERMKQASPDRGGESRDLLCLGATQSCDLDTNR